MCVCVHLRNFLSYIANELLSLAGHDYILKTVIKSQQANAKCTICYNINRKVCFVFKLNVHDSTFPHFMCIDFQRYVPQLLAVITPDDHKHETFVSFHIYTTHIYRQNANTQTLKYEMLTENIF